MNDLINADKPALFRKYDACEFLDIGDVCRPLAEADSGVLGPVTDVINRYQVRIPQIRIIGGDSPRRGSEYFTSRQGRDQRFETGLPANALQTLLMDHSATVVVNRWDRYDDGLWRTCHAMAEKYTSEVIGNLYLSVKGSESFGRHWDDHTVLVVQLAGCKSWSFFGEERVDPRNPGISLAPPTGPPSATIRLGVGDALLVPPGVWHDVETLSTAPSAHVSIALFPLRLADWLTMEVGRLIATSDAASTELCSSGSEIAVSARRAIDLLSDSLRTS